MTQLNPYLNFNGNCREALAFYQQCLGGELFFQTVGESPMCEQMPAHMKAKILHATLSTPGVIIMGSDMLSAEGLHKGNNISLSLNFTDEASTRKSFLEFSRSGHITHPLDEMLRGGLFGMLTDQFGVNWLFNYEKQ